MGDEFLSLVCGADRLHFRLPAEFGEYREHLNRALLCPCLLNYKVNVNLEDEGSLKSKCLWSWHSGSPGRKA